jgi:crotonyl-CoA reductase
MLEYDNRYLWMHQKRIVGCHFANYREAWEANRLVVDGAIHPVLSDVYRFEDTAEAVCRVHQNQHEGKLGVLVLAPGPGLGVTDPELRDAHLDDINLFRRAA